MHDLSCASWARHARLWAEAGAVARAEGRADIAQGGQGTDAVISLMNKKAAYLADRAWLGGYLAGHNRGSVPRRPDLDGAYSTVTRYCTDHPRASVVEAAARTLRGQRVRPRRGPRR